MHKYSYAPLNDIILDIKSIKSLKRPTLVRIPATSLTSCVAFGKLFYKFEFQFPHLQRRSNSCNHLRGSLCALNEIIYIPGKRTFFIWIYTQKSRVTIWLDSERQPCGKDLPWGFFFFASQFLNAERTTIFTYFCLCVPIKTVYKISTLNAFLNFSSFFPVMCSWK